MASKPSLAIIGPGNLGSALARALHGAGYRISEIVYRRSGARARRLAAQVGSKAASLDKAQLAAEIVWICVPDASIAGCARALAARPGWQKKVVLHPSGALASNELEALRRRGAAVGSAHPLMTFVRRSSPGLAGVPFALEGDPAAVRAARRMLRDLGAESFSIRSQDKALYHAWGTFASPLLVALLTTAERVAMAAGVRSAAGARRRMLPILQQTLRNYGALGPADAFSGPLVRGDVATVRRHLQALRKVPAARQVYLALAQMALLTLPVRNHQQLKQALGNERVAHPKRRRR